ncbi:MAG: hypothetical protein J0G95_18150 [Rhizobiales bacterium]|nr:hypothetical protein [Hyphomicrobiales bacterium]
MSDWPDALARRTIQCRIWQNGSLLQEFVPENTAQLLARITIADLGETVTVMIEDECRAFAAGGHAAERFDMLACRTIVKLGEAIQFKAPFVAEFRRLAERL